MIHPLLGKAWWMFALRGAAAIVFGVLAIVWPDLTLLALVALFASFAIVSGGISIVAALRHRTERGWWLFLLAGVAGILAGAGAIFYPLITTLLLVLLMGGNALVTGVFDIAAAVRLRKTIPGEWTLLAAGIVSVIFGLLVFLFPGAGAFALVWLVSFYAVMHGVLLLTIAFRMRAHRARREHASSAA